ncbi:MAG: hypothetical protein M1813_004835 [Trichoglossum hirsutum]|nr:MAG: hypothetical protein M1813_004835 [Trichoglossum hirsutum]
MKASLVHSALLSPLAFAALAYAGGARQVLCETLKFENDGTWNTNIWYDQVQQQSRSSICGSFKRELDGDLSSSCPHDGINCATTLDGEGIGIGVHMKTTNQFNAGWCIQTAFARALEATIDPSSRGMQCVATFTHGREQSSKLRRSAKLRRDGAELTRASTRINFDDWITINGERLYVYSWEWVMEVGKFLTIPSDFAENGLGQLSQRAGSTGNSIAEVRSRMSNNAYSTVSFDAGISGGAGSIGPSDWEKILAPLSTMLADPNRLAGAIRVKFARTLAAGAATVLLVEYYLQL